MKLLTKKIIAYIDDESIMIILSTASDLPSSIAPRNGIIFANESSVTKTAMWAITLLLSLTPLFKTMINTPIPTGIREVGELDSRYPKAQLQLKLYH